MSEISQSNKEKNIKILDSRSFNLSLDDTVFELTMNLSETFIQFKLIPKNSNASYCYKENYDLSAMNKNSFGFFKELKKSFEVYSQILKDNKVKFALWFAPETRELVEENYRSDGCRSMGEYIEKAILFYTGYRHAEHAEYYLPEALNEVLSRVASDFGDRIGSLLYKQAVEQNIGNHILAADTDMDVETYEKLRSRSLREVKSTNGKISFKDDLIFQKSLW
jgi:hypothetical protein